MKNLFVALCVLASASLFAGQQRDPVCPIEEGCCDDQVCPIAPVVPTTNIVVDNEDGSVTILEPRVLANGEEMKVLAPQRNRPSSVPGLCRLKGFGADQAFSVALYRGVDANLNLVNENYVALNEDGFISYMGNDNHFTYIDKVTCASAE